MGHLARQFPFLLSSEFFSKATRARKNTKKEIKDYICERWIFNIGQWSLYPFRHHIMMWLLCLFIELAEQLVNLSCGYRANTLLVGYLAIVVSRTSLCGIAATSVQKYGSVYLNIDDKHYSIRSVYHVGASIAQCLDYRALNLYIYPIKSNAYLYLWDEIPWPGFGIKCCRSDRWPALPWFRPYGSIVNVEKYAAPGSARVMSEECLSLRQLLYDILFLLD